MKLIYNNKLRIFSKRLLRDAVAKIFFQNDLSVISHYNRKSYVKSLDIIGKVITKRMWRRCFCSCVTSPQSTTGKAGKNPL